MLSKLEWPPPGVKWYYSDDAVCIAHADCRDILPLLPKVDLVLTDPPYKLSQDYGTQIDADNLRNVASVVITFPRLAELLHDGRFFITFYDNRILPFLFDTMARTNLTYLRSVYLYRRWGQASRWGGWMTTTDPICLFRKHSDVPITWGKGEVVHDCYTKTEAEDYNGEHPAQKPLFVLKHIISWCSAETELILDPYMGSGTTLRAAKDLGRRAIGIEIEERYCEIAARRLAKAAELPVEATLCA